MLILHNDFMNKIEHEAEWIQIKDGEGYYVSADGRIKRMYRNGRVNVLQPWEDTSGYLTVHIRNKNKRVHRLVAEAFIPNPRNLSEVHHRNGNKADNRAENLIWTNRRVHMKKHLAIPIVCLDQETYKLIASYTSAAEAERKTGISQRGIRTCCNRQNSLYKGYRWMKRIKYEELLKFNKHSCP